MNIKEMNAYTNAQNGASKKKKKKVGFNFVEDYPDNDGVIWKWWQLESTKYEGKNTK